MQTIILKDENRTWCVYTHHIQKRLIYVGSCKLKDFYNFPDARRISKWIELTNLYGYVEIELNSVHDIEWKALNHASQLRELLKPECNGSYRVDNYKAVIRCKETGVIYHSMTDAAKFVNATVSAISQHLSGKKNFGRVKGFTFERIIDPAYEIDQGIQPYDAGINFPKHIERPPVEPPEQFREAIAMTKPGYVPPPKQLTPEQIKYRDEQLNPSIRVSPNDPRLYPNLGHAPTINPPPVTAAPVSYPNIVPPQNISNNRLFDGKTIRDYVLDQFDKPPANRPKSFYEVKPPIPLNELTMPEQREFFEAIPIELHPKV